MRSRDHRSYGQFHLGINFGSFISTPGGNAAQFVLLDAPTNQLILSNYQAISDKINPSGTSNGQIPFNCLSGVNLHVQC